MENRYSILTEGNDSAQEMKDILTNIMVCVIEARGLVARQDSGRLSGDERPN